MIIIFFNSCQTLSPGNFLSLLSGIPWAINIIHQSDFCEAYSVNLVCHSSDVTYSSHVLLESLGKGEVE